MKSLKSVEKTKDKQSYFSNFYETEIQLFNENEVNINEELLGIIKLIDLNIFYHSFKNYCRIGLFSEPHRILRIILKHFSNQALFKNRIPFKIYLLILFLD